MSTPQLNTQLYITAAELSSLGISKQFLNSPLLTSPVVDQPWVSDTTFASQSSALISPLTWGAVTHTGTGPAGTVTFAGTPFAPAPVNILVDILTPGVVGVATFQFSTDGGVTWSGETTTAASVVLEATGIAVDFAAGTYVSSDTYATAYTGNGYIYAAMPPGGETGSIQPTWPTQLGATVLDGTVTWLNIGPNNAISVAILGASEEANMDVGQAYGLPLISWGYDLKRLVAKLTAMSLAQVRGYNPAFPAEAVFETAYKMAKADLKQVANRTKQLDVVGQNSQAAAVTNPTTGPGLQSPALPCNSWGYGTRGANQR